jgi:hypothetical protein
MPRKRFRASLTDDEIRHLATRALGYGDLTAHDLLEGWLRDPAASQASAEASWLRHTRFDKPRTDAPEIRQRRRLRGKVA